jgi:hypothetical protein
VGSNPTARTDAGATRRRNVGGGGLDRRRAQLFTRWDATGGPDPWYRWWIVSPWRWLLGGAVAAGLLAAIGLLLGTGVPDRLWLLPLFVTAGLSMAGGLHDEWLATRHPDGSSPRTLPDTARRLQLGAVAMLVVVTVGVVALSTSATSPPDTEPIAEALFGADTDLALLPSDTPSTAPREVSVLDHGGWSWSVATLGESGRCYLFAFEEGEVVDRGREADPTGGCTAEVAAAQLGGSSP